MPNIYTLRNVLFLIPALLLLTNFSHLPSQDAQQKDSIRVAGQAKFRPQTELQLARVNQLKQRDPAMRIRWDATTGVPQRLTGVLSESIEAEPKEIAIRFFKSNEALFQMTRAEEELILTSVKADERGWKHTTLQQVYQAIPVEGKTLLVHINDNNEIQIVTGRYLPNIDVDTTPSISSTAAVESAMQDLNTQEQLREEPRAELVVYEFENTTYLAWKIYLLSIEPLGNFIYYVDAHTADVIDRYNDLKFSLNRRTYDAANNWVWPGTLVRSEGEAAVNDDAIDAAHANAGRVYNKYYNVFGRDSYDGQGATIKSVAHLGVDYNNAFWDGTYLVYGDGDGTVFIPLSQALDIVAHEFTHAVTDYESDLTYRDQSGALNESLSDIFSAFIDPDWMIGEDVFTPGTAGDALRYMDNPPLGDQPDHMNDFVVPDPAGNPMELGCYSTNDRYNGCVHYNSGIPNKAAYLMADGGTHHNIEVLGMGRTAMNRIFYEAQINWLQPSSDFIDARDATLDAVVALFLGDISKYNTVQSAWAAVGVGAPPGFVLTLSPSKLTVGDDGATKDLTALVTDGGSPVPGATVSTSSANTSRATVAPSTGTTDEGGLISITVTGHERGNTIITSTATDGTRSAPATVTVKVPTISNLGLIILGILITIIAAGSARRTQSSESVR